jgi:hypothetical protein
MDKSKYTIYWESIRLVMVAILFYFGDWFGLNNTTIVTEIILPFFYLLFSFVGSVYFSIMNLIKAIRFKQRTIMKQQPF